MLSTWLEFRGERLPRVGTTLPILVAEYKITRASRANGNIRITWVSGKNIVIKKEIEFEI